MDESDTFCKINATKRSFSWKGLLYNNYDIFHHDLSFLIIIGAVTVAATAGILIDFDDCLHHHNEYEKWVTNIYIVCTISHTFNINYWSRDWWNVIFFQINSPLPKSIYIYNNAWPIMMNPSSKPNFHPIFFLFVEFFHRYV